MSWRMFVPDYPEDRDDGGSLDEAVIAGLQVVLSGLRMRLAETEERAGRFERLYYEAEQEATRLFYAVHDHRKVLKGPGFQSCQADRRLWDVLEGADV